MIETRPQKVVAGGVDPGGRKGFKRVLGRTQCQRLKQTQPRSAPAATTRADND
jgi:hypothetical protein